MADQKKPEKTADEPKPADEAIQSDADAAGKHALDVEKAAKEADKPLVDADDPFKPDAEVEADTKTQAEVEDDYDFGDPIIEAPEEVEEHPVEEPHHTSLAARVLQGLALIAVGIALALWGAPKIAPLLPAGLSPVAEFLMPGQTETRAEMEALRSTLEGRIAELENRPAGGMDAAALSAAIAEYDAKLQEELSGIRDNLASTDGQDIEARLAAMETRVEGISAELAAVSERLSAQITENGVALSEEAAAKLSGYQAALEGLRAEVKDLAAKNGALSQKVEEIATAAARRVEEAEQEASTRVATTATRQLLTEIDAALDTGAPFDAALSGLTEVASVEPPAALAAVSQSGTPSWTTLRNSFADQAHAALRADATASANEGAGSRLGAFLRTQIGTRSLQRRDGADTDAILSRVEDDLVNRRLSAALGEADSLPDAAKAAISDWIADLRALTEARQALQQLNDSLGASQ